MGRVSSLDTGGDQGTPCVGVECSHERCSNMTSMYKVVKTVTSTKFRHEPFQDFYEVYEEIGRLVEFLYSDKLPLLNPMQICQWKTILSDSQIK